jgi:hypothetical protein
LNQFQQQQAAQNREGLLKDFKNLDSILAAALLGPTCDCGDKDDQNGQSKKSSSSEGKPRRVSNSKHHANSASPEPKNVQELFDKSIADGSGTRAKDADGTIHRFSAPSNGETHWNGSTAGPKPIRMDDIPIEIRRALN